MLADITQTSGTEQGIGTRMGNGVGIAVALQRPLAREGELKIAGAVGPHPAVKLGAFVLQIKPALDAAHAATSFSLVFRALR